MATLAARTGLRVLIVDADGGLSNVDVLLGAKPVYTLSDLLRGTPVEQVLHQVRPGLTLLAGAQGERRLAQLDDASRGVLLSVWTELLARFDLVVVDVGSGVGDDVLFFSSAGQISLLVVTDEPTSIADAVVMLKALRAKTSIREVDIVVNCVRTPKSAQAIFAKILQVSSETGLRLHLLAHIPEDQNIRRAVMAGRPLVDLAPTSPASRAFERLVQTLLASPPRLSTGGVWLTEAQLSPERWS
jgi:flagellar biosynthesis protein FlhG